MATSKRPTEEFLDQVVSRLTSLWEMLAPDIPRADTEALRTAISWMPPKKQEFIASSACSPEAAADMFREIRHDVAWCAYLLDQPGFELEEESSMIRAEHKRWMDMAMNERAKHLLPWRCQPATYFHRFTESTKATNSRQPKRKKASAHAQESAALPALSNTTCAITTSSASEIVAPAPVQENDEATGDATEATSSDKQCPHCGLRQPNFCLTDPFLDKSDEYSTALFDAFKAENPTAKAWLEAADLKLRSDHRHNSWFQLLNLAHKCPCCHCKGHSTHGNFVKPARVEYQKMDAELDELLEKTKGELYKEYLAKVGKAYTGGPLTASQIKQLLPDGRDKKIETEAKMGAKMRDLMLDRLERSGMVKAAKAAKK